LKKPSKISIISLANFRKNFIEQKNRILKWTYMAAIILIAVLAVVTAIPAINTIIVAVSATPRQLPIYSVERDDRKISISFDAAWGAEDLDALLETLAEFDVRTTFFVCGYWVEKYPEEVKRIHAAGHDIGNHGDTHAHGAQLNLEQNKQEIMGTHEKVKELLGIEMDLFRPPYGEYNNTVISAADALGYFTIQWNVDSHDWQNKGPRHQINQVLDHENLDDGAIILFHSDAKDTPITLRPILEGLIEKGFEIVPISELIHREGFTIDSAGRQRLN